jgi:hypothetical protein
MIKRIVAIVSLLSLSLISLEFINTNQFVLKINLPQSQFKSGNVIQGLCKLDDGWLISQTNNNRKIIFTIIDEYGEIIYNQVVKYPSHGQDLSLKKIANNRYYIITSSKNNNGVAIFQLDLNKRWKKITFVKDRFLSYGFNTPSISKDGNYIFIKNYNVIRAYKSKDFIKLNLNKPSPIYSFILSKIQQKKSQWFQGIAIKDGYIYTLSGNKKMSSNKYLFIYDFYGKEIKKIQLFTGKDISKREGKKWELEGLEFVGNSLYTTVMSGADGKNIKRIYKILEIK